MKCRMFRNLPFTHMINKKIGTVENYCEIGIDRGLSAETTLKNIELKKLWLCDINVNPIVYDKFKKQIWKQKVRITQLPSLDFLRMFKDNFFDVIWLDGNHTYTYLQTEIPLAWAKTKTILGGHDFFAQTPGVAKAVIEFSEKNNLEIKGICTNWWFEKTYGNKIN